MTRRRNQRGGAISAQLQADINRGTAGLLRGDTAGLCEAITISQQLAQNIAATNAPDTPVGTLANNLTGNANALLAVIGCAPGTPPPSGPPPPGPPGPPAPAPTKSILGRAWNAVKSPFTRKSGKNAVFTTSGSSAGPPTPPLTGRLSPAAATPTATTAGPSSSTATVAATPSGPPARGFFGRAWNAVKSPFTRKNGKNAVFTTSSSAAPVRLTHGGVASRSLIPAPGPSVSPSTSVVPAPSSGGTGFFSRLFGTRKKNSPFTKPGAANRNQPNTGSVTLGGTLPATQGPSPPRRNIGPRINILPISGTAAAVKPSLRQAAKRFPVNPGEIELTTRPTLRTNAKRLQRPNVPPLTSSVAATVVPQNLGTGAAANPAGLGNGALVAPSPANLGTGASGAAANPAGLGPPAAVANPLGVNAGLGAAANPLGVNAGLGNGASGAAPSPQNLGNGASGAASSPQNLGTGALGAATSPAAALAEPAPSPQVVTVDGGRGAPLPPSSLRPIGASALAPNASNASTISRINTPPINVLSSINSGSSSTPAANPFSSSSSSSTPYVVPVPTFTGQGAAAINANTNARPQRPQRPARTSFNINAGPVGARQAPTPLSPSSAVTIGSAASPSRRSSRLNLNQSLVAPAAPYFAPPSQQQRQMAANLYAAAAAPKVKRVIGLNSNSATGNTTARARNQGLRSTSKRVGFGASATRVPAITTVPSAAPPASAAPSAARGPESNANILARIGYSALKPTTLAAQKTEEDRAARFVTAQRVGQSASARANAEEAARKEQARTKAQVAAAAAQATRNAALLTAQSRPTPGTNELLRQGEALTESRLPPGFNLNKVRSSPFNQRPVSYGSMRPATAAAPAAAATAAAPQPAQRSFLQRPPVTSYNPFGMKGGRRTKKSKQSKQKNRKSRKQ